MNWQDYLEIVGERIFLRYRKRLMQPGITLEILRDHPGASLIDAAIRVHAGRRLLRDGDDFRAMALIRSGVRPERAAAAPVAAVGRAGPADGLSRGLVILGGMIFALFCLLTLGDVMGVAGLLVGGVLAALLVFWRTRYRLLSRWRRTRRVAGGDDGLTGDGCRRASDGSGTQLPA